MRPTCNVLTVVAKQVRSKESTTSPTSLKRQEETIQNTNIKARPAGFFVLEVKRTRPRAGGQENSTPGRA
eukprot:4214154-Amphidinium_carterae.1